MLPLLGFEAELVLIVTAGFLAIAGFIPAAAFAMIVYESVSRIALGWVAWLFRGGD